MRRGRHRERGRGRGGGRGEGERRRALYYSYILLSSGLDVDEVILDENNAKMTHITAVMMSQAAYHGYQPAPTGRAPKIIATAPTMILYSCKKCCTIKISNNTV